MKPWDRSSRYDVGAGCQQQNYKESHEKDKGRLVLKRKFDQREKRRLQARLENDRLREDMRS